MSNQSPTGKLWERQDGESAKAYEAFLFYLKLEPRQRSVRAAHEAYKQQSLPLANSGQKQGSTLPKTPPGNWRAWANKYQWNIRASAYDQEKVFGELNKKKPSVAKFNEILDKHRLTRLEDGEKLRKVARLILEQVTTKLRNLEKTEEAIFANRSQLGIRDLENLAALYSLKTISGAAADAAKVIQAASSEESGADSLAETQILIAKIEQELANQRQPNGESNE